MYIKTKWIGNQTVISAKAMNNIENGIEKVQNDSFVNIQYDSSKNTLTLTKGDGSTQDIKLNTYNNGIAPGVNSVNGETGDIDMSINNNTDNISFNVNNNAYGVLKYMTDKQVEDIKALFV